ncbi:nucleotidyltransferase domain-containing protein [Alicyclobacillus sp. SO9]|uniref:nucleotidyltransferase domain-containing protein n=1 Tax=Alicyclobacillus sp. SO9 TaxID=2665646 RepID=UPI0018E8CB53|nr:nucleotidyltransferase domain-containing protein [Alicyclobacillus sp. SO9]QQE79646.1 nucleotidyltransferase domain-containing protein [Alicyclobacillus sp. SO9]
MTRNDVLMDLGRRCLKELNLPNMKYAFLGGSVGRGDADEFSDVDITICVEESASFETQNLIYEGEFVQVDFISPITLDAIMENPLDYRHLLESKALYDPLGNFEAVQGEARQYFASTIGQTQTFAKWTNVVEQRKHWAVNSMEQNTLYSATVAGEAAWTDAAFMAMFFDTGSCSTGMLIPWMKTNFDFQIIEDLCKWLNVSEADVRRIVRAIERFREFLRKQYPDRAHDFVLSPIQDALNAKKAQRLVKTGQLASLAWQFSGEAFWLYLETANGLPLDEYIEKLPKPLAIDLERAGFVSLDSSSIRKLCRVADDLILRVHQSS